MKYVGGDHWKVYYSPAWVEEQKKEKRLLVLNFVIGIENFVYYLLWPFGKKNSIILM